MLDSVVLFLAGGSGSRMRGVVADKIFAPLAGAPVLARAVRAFAESGVARAAVFVCRDDAQEVAVRETLAEHLAPDAFPLRVFCRGGGERRDSVFNGLRAARERGVPADAVALIHDAARPLVSSCAVREVFEIARREGAAVLARRCVNTVKRVPAGTTSGVACLQEDLERARLWETETPQAFPLGKIFDAYARAVSENRVVTDDVSAFAAPVALVENLSPNPKITCPQDLLIAEVLLARS